MENQVEIREDQILKGSQFDEPMLVVKVKKIGHSLREYDLVGQRSRTSRSVLLTTRQISEMEIIDPTLSYSGDGHLLRIALQAYSLGIAYEFDPFFGLSISRVDPLPHQLEAVYEHLLKTPSVRFLLADDAGAGKTIMAGLLVRELKLRGLIERILVVCPANLTFQWQRELKEKFDEKFEVFKGSVVRNQFGINKWVEQNHVITSLDFAKRDDIIDGLKQASWDLVIIDEAHRMSAYDESHRSQRYRLGELLRDSTDHILLLTATPHKGDPKNFTFFLQLLDQDAYADVKSIKEAMNERRAPFYLRRTKEAMVYFPELQSDGSWVTRPVFTERIPKTASFELEGMEFELYEKITRFVKRQSRRAAARDDNPRSRAVFFLMSLYQRRLASSTHAMRRSLEKRAKRLENALKKAAHLTQNQPFYVPDWDELDEYEDSEREKLEELLEAITLTERSDEVKEEIAELLELAEEVRVVQNSRTEAKLDHLRKILKEEGFFERRDQRLLIFTEFKDTLEYLMENLSEWGFTVDCIHGGMKPGSRNEPGTRLFVEQQFREGTIQVLVATEAAGEGINLQCCNILFNYDIPWNPNRLEQRMGRIHRYGQRKKCLIFNFVATNTIEGRVLQRLLDKLQEIRDALDDDAVFNVVGEVLPSNQIERILRAYYSGELGTEDLEERLLERVDERHFKEICQTALEGLATKQLNLDLLVERRASAQEKRVIPETIARFLAESAKLANLTLKPVQKLKHTFQPGRTPQSLKEYEYDKDRKLSGELLDKYLRISTDRETADAHHLEWVYPGHPLFGALQIYIEEKGEKVFASGACFYSLKHDRPARLDFYKAQVVDGLAKVIHERLFVVEISESSPPCLVDQTIIGDMTPTSIPEELPSIVHMQEDSEWLYENALMPFLDQVLEERVDEIDNIAKHVEISLTEVLNRIDQEVGRAQQDVEDKVGGAAGRFSKAQRRQDELIARRSRRRRELQKQRSLTLQGVERITGVLVLPHPERDSLELHRLRPHPETEMTAMRIVMEHEESQGRVVDDVHKENLGYDIKSTDPKSGELRLIEIKGLAGSRGNILFTPNELRVAEDRPDCYWLYVVTSCATNPKLLEPIKNPAQCKWNEITKVERYWLNVKNLRS